MRRVRLKMLEVLDFKGVRHFALHPGGEDMTITGRNGTGKTTLADAYAWLLWGKDSLGSSAFQVKPILATDGETKREGAHTVHAVLNVDGEDVHLSRTLREKWVRPRGKAQKVLAGHEVAYAVNGMSVKQGEYAARIAEIFGGEDNARMLSDPLHFAQGMTWQERRSVLLALAPEVTPDDVLMADRSLAPLAPLLIGTPVEALRDMAKANAADLRRKLDRYGARIEEARRGINVMLAPPAKLRDDLAWAEKEARAETQRLKDAQAALTAAQETLAKAQAARHEARFTALRDQQKKQRQAALDVSEARARLASIEQEGKALAQGGATCPACGQPLAEVDAKEIEAKRKKLRAEYREAKAALAAREEALGRVGDEPLTLGDDAVREAQAAVDAAKALMEGLEPEDHEPLLAELRSRLAASEASEAAKQRAQALMDEEKGVAEEYEQAAALIDLCERYARAHVALVEGQVNARFQIVRWRMFEEQLNGELRDAATPTVAGVPWGNLNTGSKLNAGLDIINALSEHLGVSAPVWLDGAESLTSVQPVAGQLIALRVTEDEALTAQVAA